MKKIGILLLALIMTIGLCACGEAKYADDDFAEDLAAGLAERFAEVARDLADEDFQKIAPQSDEYKEYMQKYIRCELDKVEKYLDEKFKDKDLKEAAVKYINILKEEMESTELIPKDYFGEFTGKWSEIIDRKNEVLDQFSDEFDITLPEPDSLLN